MPGITTTNLGRVVPLFKGEYNASSTYTKLDVVLYNGSSYILKVDSATGVSPTTSAYWQKIAEKGIQGDTGDQGPAGKIINADGTIQMLGVDADPIIEVINRGTETEANLQFNFGIPVNSEPVFRGNYNSTTYYNKFDNVLYQGSTYISLIDNNRGNTPYGSQYWQLLAEKGDQGNQGNVTPLGQVTATAAAASEAAVTINQTGDYGENIAFSFGLPAGPIGFDTVTASAVSGSSTAEPDVEATIETIQGNRNLNFEFTIPAAEGTGVNSVDSIGPNASGDIDLKAIRYAQQNLPSASRKIARENINAMEEPSVKEYGAFLRYSGDVANPQWLAEQISQVPGGGVSGYVLRKQVDGYGWTPVYEVPSGGTTGSILAKNSNTSYDLTWTGNITNADIDTIMSE